MLHLHLISAVEVVRMPTYVLQATPETPEKSIFIHPVLRTYDATFKVKDELHLLENLESTWDDEELHLQPHDNATSILKCMLQ